MCDEPGPGVRRERELGAVLLLRVPYTDGGTVGGDLNTRAALATTAAFLIAELTANATLHGRVRGREARLDVRLGAGELRIDVTDARGDRWPTPQHPRRRR